MIVPPCAKVEILETEANPDHPHQSASSASDGGGARVVRRGTGGAGLGLDPGRRGGAPSAIARARLERAGVFLILFLLGFCPMEIIDDSYTQEVRTETRTCRICGEVGHLARSCPQAPEKGPELRTCRICGEVGHIAGSCPSVDPADRQPDTRRCHICGEVGHIARNCPSEAAMGDAGFENGGGRRKKGGTAGRRCFNCGKTGHLSADCDLPAGNTACYNCGQSGHKSAECPN